MKFLLGFIGSTGLCFASDYAYNLDCGFHFSGHAHLSLRSQCYIEGCENDGPSRRNLNIRGVG